MRVHTTIHTATTQRPVRKQPAQRPHVPAEEGLGKNPGLTAAEPKKQPKTVPTPPAPPKQPMLGNDNSLELKRKALGLPPFPITNNPVPSGPRPTLAPTAPGFTPNPNFGFAPPAASAWSVAATLVSEG